MSVAELDLILKKDPIIATWPVSALKTNPAQVEQDYATHAKTHLSLGDTQQYVDTLFKWVGGANKGAFVGAVEGNYGEGKTSFLVHLWAESVSRKVFTVPPFEWTSLDDAVDGVAAWVQYGLGRTYPALAKRAQHVHEEFSEKTIEDVAAEAAKETGQDYATVRATLRALRQQGTDFVTEVSAERFLDYCAQVTDIVKEAGYKGLLVLLDEPEVAARKSGKERVAQWLFELANELHRREGSYGVFVSMPTNFLADIQRRYPALTARLQVRNCFPRLRDVYGPSFAEDLWARYAAEFGLGEDEQRIVSSLALQAIGQVASSERSDLSYGPRTVVSAFNRMVYRYRETGQTYEPETFAQDCLDDEVMIQGEYPSRVQEALRSPEVDDTNRAAALFLAAFPNGLRIEVAKEKGIEQILLGLCRRGSLVYKTSFIFGLHILRRSDITEVDPLRELILDIAGQFAPSQASFAKALSGFERHCIPLIFAHRQGQQLVGWEELSPWRRSRRAARVAARIGAFAQTQHQYPRRAVLLVTGSLETPINDVPMPRLAADSGPLRYDAVFHFRFRWHGEQEAVGRELEINRGDLSRGTIPLVRLTADLQDRVIRHDMLAELLDASTLTPFFLLYLITRMDEEPLPKEVEAQWLAMLRTILRELVPAFFGEELAALAAEQLGQPVAGAALELLGSIFQRLLQMRYPNYSTLIHSPQWEQKIDDYTRALKSTDIPLACKRGREKWVAEGDSAAKALGTSRMNLTGGGFSGLDNLLDVTQTGGRNAPLEVEFRIHPLEQEIVEAITSDESGRKKVQIDGVECWWLPSSDLLPLISESGYSLEELKHIIDIGTSRGSFGATSWQGEQILYCKPIDPEQMREQLLARLAELVAEIAEFNKLPEFTSHFDAKAMEAQIAALADEADHDRLMTALDREFQRLHGLLPGYYSALQQQFLSLRNEVKNIPGQLTSAREVANLKNSPSGKSRWCADLLKYILGNLRKSVQDMRSQAESLLGELDGQVDRFGKAPSDAKEALALLLQGRSDVIDATASTRQARQHRDDLISTLRDYEEWLRLLRRSDEIYEALLQLGTEELHKLVAEELLADFDRVSEEISDHLQVRNVQGLDAHKQYAASLEDIDERRRKYLTELKGGFDKRKDAVNQLLAALKLDRRVSIVFNPMDIEGCYTEMFEQAAVHIREGAIRQPLVEAESQQRELVYAKDVIRAVEDADAGPLLERLAGVRARLSILEGKVTKEWVQAVTEPSGEADAGEIGEAMTQALGAVREARRLIKQTAKPTLPREGRPKFMHDQIPEKGDVDFKQLILQMMADSDDPSHALDESLGCLVDLFKRNCIQVKVERRRV